MAMWRCDDTQCGALNKDGIYRCAICDKVKPYRLSPVDTDSLPSPPSSPTHVAPRLGGLGEGSPHFPTTPPGTDAVEMRSMSPRCDPWGGARPKHRDTAQGVFGNPSAPDRQPLLAGDSEPEFGYSRQVERQPQRYDYGEVPQAAAASRTWDYSGGSSYSDDRSPNFPDTECRLVLLGKTGNGKSSAGNTILGKQVFKEGGGLTSQTATCQRHGVHRFGVCWEVVDTPGFFDTNTPKEQLVQEILKCINMVLPGPHALALVIGGRFTEEQVETVEQVRALFGPQVMRHMLIIFTFGDNLSRGQGEGRCEDTIREEMNKVPVLRKLIMEDLDNRYVVFNNVGSPQEKDRQVHQLLLMIRGILSQNENKPFQKTRLEDCENIVRNYETRVLALLNTNDTMTRQQVRRVFRAMMDKDEDTKDLLEKLLSEADVCFRCTERSGELSRNHDRDDKTT